MAAKNAHTPDWKEQRRWRALDLKRDGWTHHEIAEALDVTKGAVSQWRIELPASIRQFDYDTVSDVVLHLRYTAREGGLALRSAATAALQDKIVQAATVGSTRLLSVRDEFPTEWARFKRTTPPQGQSARLAFELDDNRFPYRLASVLPKARQMHVFAATQTRPAWNPFVMNVFEPLMTYWSPSRRAVVLIPCRSEPAAGSVIAIAATSSPRAMRGNQWRFCSSLPYARM